MPETIACQRCGAPFACGARDAICWCVALPALAMPPLPTGPTSMPRAEMPRAEMPRAEMPRAEMPRAGPAREPGEASCLCPACLRLALERQGRGEGLLRGTPAADS